jgi:hypothetical protein
MEWAEGLKPKWFLGSMQRMNALLPPIRAWRGSAWQQVPFRNDRKKSDDLPGSVVPASPDKERL